MSGAHLQVTEEQGEFDIQVTGPAAGECQTIYLQTSWVMWSQVAREPGREEFNIVIGEVL